MRTPPRWRQQPLQQQAETEQMAAMSRRSAWIAFKPEPSGMSHVSVHETEVDALRTAVAGGLQVKRVRFGEVIAHA